MAHTHTSSLSFLILLSFLLNLALSTRLISWDDQWKGAFFLHSHRDTRNTELMKEWWYLITFQRIAPASQPTFAAYLEMDGVQMYFILAAQQHMVVPLISLVTREVGISCVVREF